MKQFADNDILRITGKNYILELRPGNAPARLFCKGTEQVYFFYPGGDCNIIGSHDCAEGYEDWRILDESPGTIVAGRMEKSALWKQKELRFVFRPTSIEMYHLLEGEGILDDVRFCRGCTPDEEFGWVGEYDEIFNPAPNFQERQYYSPGTRFTISNGNDLSPEVGGQALASCCHCIGLHDRRDRKFLGVGIAALPGEYTWHEFVWNPQCLIPPTPFIGDQILGGGFAVTYHGTRKISGKWESPRLIFTFPEDENQILPEYLRHCYRQGYLPRPHRRKTYAWWNTPIYCTWHDQCAMAARYHRQHPGAPRLPVGHFISEELLEEWLEALISHDCRPGIVILDDKWQKNLNDGTPDTEKFPDMRKWIEKCHKRGIRVFLWTAAWNTDNLPPEQCMTRNGKPICGDITNPIYEKRFREMIRKYFSDEPDCLNADGVKMDGLLSLPTGPGLTNHENLWGLELQKRYLQILFEEARKHKKDACISTFTAHPYLAEYCDMVRLGDMYSPRLTPHRSMLYRARVLRTVTPYALIDTDGQFTQTMTDNYADELAEQAKIGIPTLYNAKILRQSHAFLPSINTDFTEEDYRKFSDVFHAYVKSPGTKAITRKQPSRPKSGN